MRDVYKLLAVCVLLLDNPYVINTVYLKRNASTKLTHSLTTRTNRLLTLLSYRKNFITCLFTGK